MPQPTTLTCVIPCLNEEANLQVLLPLLTTVLDSLSLEYEVIVVDDGSTDGTSAAMHVLAARHPEIVYMQLSRNFGKEAALTARSEEHTSELQSLMRISYAVFCLKKTSIVTAQHITQHN